MQNPIPARQPKPARGCRPAHDAGHDRLIADHLKLVESIARGVIRRLPPAFDLADLVGVGNLALCRAAANYRPDDHGGAPFSAYARQVIRGAMIESVRRRHYTEATRPPLDAPEVQRWLRHRPEIEGGIDARRRHGRILDALTWLSPTEQAVVAAHFGREEATPAAIAARLGMTTARASQILDDAIGRIRTRLRV